MKTMTLNTMLYDHINVDIETMSLDDFRKLCNDICNDDDNNYPMKINVEPEPEQTSQEELQDPCYIRWQMFDEIPERIYTIQCEGYFDKNNNPLNDEESIKYLTSSEHIDIDVTTYSTTVDDMEIHDDDIELCDEYGNVIGYLDYDDFYYH